MSEAPSMGRLGLGSGRSAGLERLPVRPGPVGGAGPGAAPAATLRHHAGPGRQRAGGGGRNPVRGGAGVRRPGPQLDSAGSGAGVPDRAGELPGWQLRGHRLLPQGVERGRRRRGLEGPAHRQAPHPPGGELRQPGPLVGGRLGGGDRRQRRQGRLLAGHRPGGGCPAHHRPVRRCPARLCPGGIRPAGGDRRWRPDLGQGCAPARGVLPLRGSVREQG